MLVLTLYDIATIFAIGVVIMIWVIVRTNDRCNKR